MRIPRKRDCLGEENKKFTPNFRGDNHQVHLSKEGADEVVLLMVTFQRQAYTSDVFGWVELNTAILEEFRQATVRVLKKCFHILQSLGLRKYMTKIQSLIIPLRELHTALQADL